MTAGLFPEPDRVGGPRPDVDERSKGRRRQDAHLAAIARGHHPLSTVLGPLPLHVDASRSGERVAGDGPTCGQCRFRELFYGGARSYPKCTFGTLDRTRPATDEERKLYGRTVMGEIVRPRTSHGEGTDVRGWWPACQDFQRTGNEACDQRRLT